VYEYYEAIYNALGGSSDQILISRSFFSIIDPESGEAILGVNGLSEFSLAVSDFVFNGVVMPRNYKARRLEICAIGVDNSGYVSGDGEVKLWINGVYSGLSVSFTCTDVSTMVVAGLDINVDLYRGDVLSFTLVTPDDEADFYAGVASVSGY
jgi:hypothetical protein